MQHPEVPRKQGPDDPAGTKRRRLVLFGAGALALVLAIIGTVAAVESGPSSTQARQPSAITAPPDAAASQPRGHHQAPKPDHASKSAPAPVLADGTYPTYVKGVDVEGATVTVDVLQAFQNEDAVQAAIEDGMSAEEAAIQYIYIRNQNPLLRTLPVAADVQIDFLGSCEGPSDRDALLSELKDATTPFTTLYYYDITVENGAIQQIVEHVAEAAC
jgi:hypothetical protein